MKKLCAVHVSSLRLFSAQSSFGTKYFGKSLRYFMHGMDDMRCPVHMTIWPESYYSAGPGHTHGQLQK